MKRTLLYNKEVIVEDLQKIRSIFQDFLKSPPSPIRKIIPNITQRCQELAENFESFHKRGGINRCRALLKGQLFEHIMDQKDLPDLKKIIALK